MKEATVPILEQLSILADATRVRLLVQLEQHEITVSELCEVLQLPQSTVSRHLKTLVDAGWISNRREGTSRFYALARDELDQSSHKLWLLVRKQLAGSVSVVQDSLRLEQVLARRRTRSEQFFASSAHQWDQLRAELFGDSCHLRPLLGLLDETWVVGDLGCGTGQVSEALAGFVSRVVAVDSSLEMLDAARDRLHGLANVEFLRGTLEHLPVEAGTLDAACLMLVLHHTPDPAKVLAAAAAALRPGGKLLVIDMLPHDREEYRATMGHVWLGFSEQQLTRLLDGAGFAGPRWHVLPPATQSKGPALFAAVAPLPTLKSKKISIKSVQSPASLGKEKTA